jgi:hypothetical protein
MVFFAVAVSTLLVIPETEAAGRRRAVSPREPKFNILHTEGGYTDVTSVEQGRSIRLHISSSVNPLTVRIVNLAKPEQTLRSISGLQTSVQNCSGRSRQGCGWNVTTTLDVPRSWDSGYYAAVFPTSFGERYIPFVVRENAPGSTSKIVVVSPTHTWQAYNEFGGHSLYPSADPYRATVLTYDRPYHAENGLGRFEAFEKDFVNWMTSEGRAFEVITDVDLEQPTSLSAYNVVVFPGHSEYWTAAARNNLEAFSASGGHIAILNGNTMWWQIRLSDQNRIITAYKGASDDPLTESGSPLVSTHFFSHPVNDPENKLLGTSFRNGGYVNRLDEETGAMKPIAERLPWTVTDASHWIYNGTGLNDGDTFAKETTGLEVDGVVFNCDTFGKVIGPDGSDEAPLHYEILAIVPASEGWGTLGLLVHPSGGAVFNAATNGWVWGLPTNAAVRRMTANVLERFASGAALEYRPIERTVLAQDLFNCSQPIPATGWESQSLQTRPQVNASCAYEGPGGLELSGEGVRAIARDIAPRGGESRNEAHLRFYIKADELQQRTTFPMSIVGLEQRIGNTTRRAAFVEVDASSGKRIRVARRSTAGAFSASPWVPLSDGWHLVQVSWRSPGTMTLQVDGGSAVSLEIADADQRVNRVVLAWPIPELTTAGRVCIDAFGVGATTLGSVPQLLP